MTLAIRIMPFRLNIAPALAAFSAAASLGASSAWAQLGATQLAEMPLRNSAYYQSGDMMWTNSQWGGFGMVLGPIFMILLVVAIVAGAVYLLRLFGVGGQSAAHGAHDRALLMLKERYAKGEIDSTEFAERKKLLAD